MQFEFDPAKSASNKDKHGLDFVEAQALWQDEKHIEVPTEYVDEERWMAIGMIDDRIWSAIFTWRGDVVRLISVRRSRQQEVKYYESQ